MSIARPALTAIATLGTALALACLAAPWILTLAGIDATETDLLNRLAGPSAAHPLGTDDLGRDLLEPVDGGHHARDAFLLRLAEALRVRHRHEHGDRLGIPLDDDPLAGRRRIEQLPELLPDLERADDSHGRA